MSKIILLDADVVSHFIYAGEILSLPKIFQPIPIRILDKVYEELEQWREKKIQVDNLVNMKLLEIMPFPDSNPAIVREFLHIQKMMFRGKGESACMAVAQYTKDILASSNLKDIKRYCEMHKIIYLTTMDFLCHAQATGLFDETRCNTFIQAVRSKGQKLPVERMNAFNCRDLSGIDK
ncbi:hypothetical protein GCM10028806_10630 [Spirosoma terrae]|uniref:PIN domain-containing protein n=1 Tax=Spirosoma terrae TaxID=1968276 RepID=A0A6L9LJ36_9BACT|nr:hypothetical protein [Spirosoma terrae]NDU98933.1 hypothetical protein [Spirosoma terrae]